MRVVEWSQNQRSTPRWLADFSDPNQNMARFPANLVASAFTDQAGLLVTSTGIIAQNATSGAVTVTSPLGGFVAPAISSAPFIPAGTTLYFGGAKAMTLTADLKLGDTTANFAALPTALAANDTARYNQFNQLYIPSGTPVGRTFTERTAGTGFGPADFATPDDEIFLTFFPVHDARNDARVELLRPKSGTSIYENLLPNYSTLSAGALTWLRANFNCQLFNDTP